MNPREPRPRRRFGAAHRSGTEATAPPADSENEIFFSPPPTADLGGQVAGGGWGNHALQPHSRNVEVDDRMPNHASNPFRFPVAAPFREIPDTTDYRRRTAVATTCVQTSLIGEPHTAHYTDAFAQTNYGNRANQLSTRALPSDPHPQPSAPAVEEVYVKRGKEYHIVGNFDLATLNRMRSNGLQRMSSVTSTTIQHNVLTVQDQQPFETVAHGTPMRGAEESLQQLHDWPLSPVLSATESPDHGRPFFVADRVKSLEKQARREAALERDENTLQASFHSARTSFNQPPPRQYREERQPLRFDYPRQLTIVDAGICELPMNIQLSMDLVYMFSPSLILMSNPLVCRVEEHQRLQRNMQKYWHAKEYESDYDPEYQELVCHWDIDKQTCQRALVVGQRRPDIDKEVHNWRSILLLDGTRFGQTINAPLKDLRPLAEAYLEPCSIVLCSLKGYAAETTGISNREQQKVVNSLQSQPRYNLRVVSHGKDGFVNHVEIHVRKDGAWYSFIELVGDVLNRSVR
ncbi:uncharacterized protein LOC129583915 [Paramacrobiotus metropolitanus]|uniref:uncharacterized protein LOC129583915 n=1 Tax=Paramacrobiotus metropolitanus TaxID=2943436 RepID=UPI002445C2FC|nr:uncharacterized protein LOC129583915 [Paramacrobiotus metropolitanus]XP_055331934.1 uncharacterized protein LOC129583915 [Paramacrobiotus metropolitanus]XP_055331935.1 uncharacterized protein LOC129583915 [Paramacrobiotus metropolitanus]XP_055331936.1 uncharacterized protein LOC129583915 [Paramacrobiotus metropolitanus]XP_055331937.1 uncharacterized protein LOC129583915 [Paramacrobiotus metropolitanus]XP_055331938.1 uncharacterized protein LOC129583915 [Paramacrobiotus metropolitanus]